MSPMTLSHLTRRSVLHVGFATEVLTPFCPCVFCHVGKIEGSRMSNCQWSRDQPQTPTNLRLCFDFNFGKLKITICGSTVDETT